MNRAIRELFELKLKFPKNLTNESEYSKIQLVCGMFFICFFS